MEKYFFIRQLIFLIMCTFYVHLEVNEVIDHISEQNIMLVVIDNGSQCKAAREILIEW